MRAQIRCSCGFVNLPISVRALSLMRAVLSKLGALIFFDSSFIIVSHLSLPFLLFCVSGGHSDHSKEKRLSPLEELSVDSEQCRLERN